MTWGELHVDDVVLGADQCEYVITERYAEWFALRRLNDGHRVTCSPPPQSTVTLVRRGDHRAEQVATQVLLLGGFSFGIIGEYRE